MTKEEALQQAKAVVSAINRELKKRSNLGTLIYYGDYDTSEDSGLLMFRLRSKYFPAEGSNISFEWGSSHSFLTSQPYYLSGEFWTLKDLLELGGAEDAESLSRLWNNRLCHIYHGFIEEELEKITPEMKSEFSNLTTLERTGGYGDSTIRARFMGGGSLEIAGKRGVSFYYNKHVLAEPVKIRGGEGFAEAFAEILVPAWMRGFGDILDGCSRFCESLLRKFERDNVKGKK